MKVLIAGASFAGLSSAYWMRELGHDVTVVELAPAVRRGGTAVNVVGGTIDVVKRMGLFDRIAASRLSLRKWSFKDADDRTVRELVLRAEGEPPPDDDYEIERDVLMRILLDAVAGRCEMVFGDRIVALAQAPDHVAVTFERGAPRDFDLVLGCDGAHSGVRKLVFGDEGHFSHFLEQYFSISIVDGLLVPRDTAEMFNVPGKAVMLNAYKDKTDVIFGFVSEAELPYDRRDERQQRRLVAERFAGVGWRVPALLDAVARSDSFYFDKLCQIRMPTWSEGRVALVGDAAYCASPAAGRGGSLALDGAAALADAMRDAPGDLARAFRLYDERFRPFIEAVQAEAARVGLETLVPRTEAAIAARNARTDFGF